MTKERLRKEVKKLKHQSLKRTKQLDEVLLEVIALKRVFEINEQALKSCENTNNMLKDKCHKLCILHDIYVAEIVKLKED